MTELRALVDVAARSAAVLLDTESWIHRRVYKLGYTERGMAYTNVSIDLTIDPRLVPLKAGTGTEPSVFFVPILFLRKWPPLMRLDIRGHDGLSLPLLTSEKNREVDAALLRALAPDGAIKDGIAETLSRIATEDKAEAEGRVNMLGTYVRDNAGLLPRNDLETWLGLLRVAASLASNSVQAR